MAPQKEKGTTMPLKNAKEPSDQYIQGPMMDYNPSKKDKGHIKDQRKVSNKANGSMGKESSPFTKALHQQPRSK